MISILRSNQPIAWAIIPLTTFGGLLAHWWAGTLDELSMLVHGLGLMGVAFLGHHIYISRHVVDRGDSTLAWLIVLWSVTWLNPTTWVEGLRTWGSLFLVCASLSMALTMHRQSSTSGIQFRSGALAAFAIGLNPSNWGVFLGLVAMQVNLRTGIFREWAMLFIGAAWGGAITLGMFWLIPRTIKAVDVTSSATFQSSSWLHWMTLIWAITGAIVLLRRQSSLNLRSQNARLSVLTLGWCTALGSIFSIGPDGGLAFAALPLSPTLGLAMGFTCIGLVPNLERKRRVDKPWHDAVYWMLVGTVLVLFVQRLLN
ncbi:MAG TPA: hypothetical protein DD635_07005 [Flavobacteriales bacterium]|nr:hypothetical protein [Flavobacteriales bacterium]